MSHATALLQASPATLGLVQVLVSDAQARPGAQVLKRVVGLLQELPSGVG